MRAGWNADGNDLLCFTLMTVPFSFFYARSTSSGLFSLWNMQHRYEQAVTAKKAESQYTVASRTVLILRNQATEFFLCISTSRNFYRRMFPLLKNSVPHLIPPFYVTKQILVKKRKGKKNGDVSMLKQILISCLLQFFFAFSPSVQRRCSF